MVGFKNYKTQHCSAAKPGGGDNKKPTLVMKAGVKWMHTTRGNALELPRSSRSQPPLGGFHIFGVEFDTDVPAAQDLGSQ